MADFSKKYAIVYNSVSYYQTVMNNQIDMY